MFSTYKGPCTCFFCKSDKVHPERHQALQPWRKGGHMQVAESLNPADVLHTRICPLCTHEEIEEV